MLIVMLACMVVVALVVKEAFASFDNVPVQKENIRSMIVARLRKTKKSF